MKNTPDSFDRHVKSKLDEVEVDPSLADTYWQQMQLPANLQARPNKFRRYYWFGASVLLIVLAIFTITKSGENDTININTKMTQQPENATSINRHDTILISNKKQVDSSRNKAKLSVAKENETNKSDQDKSGTLKSQLRHKPIHDSIFNQPTATLNSLHQLTENDTLSLLKEGSPQASIQQANIKLEKIDSLNKKAEAKKRAPYIIW